MISESVPRGESLHSYYFMMHPDVVYQQRAIYTFWDVISDMGGLFDAMKLIGSFVMSCFTMLTGRSLESYLITKLFKFGRQKHKLHSNNNSEENIKRNITQRIPAKFSACRWLLKRRERDTATMFEKAKRRISKELDIVNFLKHHMIDKIQKRTLFTRLERYLMKHQADPFVLTPHHERTSTDSSDSQQLNNNN